VEREQPLLAKTRRGLCAPGGVEVEGREFVQSDRPAGSLSYPLQEFATINGLVIWVSLVLKVERRIENVSGEQRFVSDGMDSARNSLGFVSTSCER